MSNSVSTDTNLVSRAYARRHNLEINRAIRIIIGTAGGSTFRTDGEVWVKVLAKTLSGKARTIRIRAQVICFVNSGMNDQMTPCCGKLWSGLVWRCVVVGVVGVVGVAVVALAPAIHISVRMPLCMPRGAPMHMPANMSVHMSGYISVHTFVHTPVHRCATCVREGTREVP